MIGSRTAASPAAAGYRFPREVIAVSVRWYLRYGLSYRDVEALLAERGIVVDHVTIYRWVQMFTPEFIDSARSARHAAWDRWFLVDETYVKVAGRWTYLYRAVDQRGQLIDVLVSTRRDAAASRSFFARALRSGSVQIEVVTDRAPVYPRVLDEPVPAARRVTDQYTNNVIEADHGRLQTAAAADARTQTPGVGAHHRRRARVRAEPPPRTPRDNRRPAGARSAPRLRSTSLLCFSDRPATHHEPGTVVVAGPQRNIAASGPTTDVHNEARR
jgi:transposase, IS6 family